jgi:hypothetical protein
MEYLPHIISGISIIGTIILGFYGFQFNRKLENLKGKVSRENYIHQLQFEKEFDIYKQLWESLTDLKNYTAQLRPQMDHGDKDKSHDELVKDRLIHIAELRNNHIEMFEKNKPFYSEQVYKKLLDFNKIIKDETFSAKYDDSTTREYWEIAKDNVEKMYSVSDEICNIIRKRITLNNLSDD